MSTRRRHTPDQIMRKLAEANKQYLAAIRPREGTLALSTVRFDDEVLACGDVSDLPARSTKADAEKLTMVTQIIDSLSSPRTTKKYHDTDTAEVRNLIRAHEKGNDVVVEQSAAAQDQVIDLMEALQASVKVTSSRRGRTKALSKLAALLATAPDRADAPESRQRATPNRSAHASTKSSGHDRSSTARSSRKESSKKALARKSA